MENFSNSIISPLVGTFVNDHFVGVTSETMAIKGDNGFMKLNIIATVLGLIQFVFIFLIPTKE